MEPEFFHLKDSTSIKKTIINKEWVQRKIKRNKGVWKLKIRKSFAIDIKESSSESC